MRCPYCMQPNSRVLDSRLIEEGRSVRRRRECIACAKRFTTYERIEQVPLLVIKKNGLKENFDNLKLFNGLIRACKKTKLTRDDIEGIVSEVECKLKDKREISSREIGEIVLAKLKSLDQVAYMRFASVYREFTDIDMFSEELEKIKREGKEL